VGPSDPYPGVVYPKKEMSKTGLIVLGTVIPGSVTLCAIVSVTVFLLTRKKADIEKPHELDPEVSPQQEKESIKSLEIPEEVPAATTPVDENQGPKDTEAPLVSSNPMDDYIVPT